MKLNAADIAKPFRDEVKVEIEQLRKRNIEPPLLVGLLANNDPAAAKYAEWTRKTFESDGIRFEIRRIGDPLEVGNALIDANDDPSVHGIIVYYPIFGQIESYAGSSQDDYLRDTISYKCDVEGFCHTYRTNLYRNVRFWDFPSNTKKCVLPCTPLAVVKILESVPGCYNSNLPEGRRMEGKIVTVINRSEVVGRPLAAMLANDGAEVYSVDINSIYIFRGGRLSQCEGETPESCVRKSSVVVTGVPVKGYRLPTEWIKENTIVVNVASFKNVDEDALLKIKGVTYIPMVGKVTVAMLERNLMRLYANFHSTNTGDAIVEKKKYDHFIQFYTAFAVTALLVITLSRSK